jgi:hypothetical protein
VGAIDDETRATASTQATGTVNTAPTGSAREGNIAASTASGNPIVITIPATGIARGLATKDTTGTVPNTKREIGVVPICAANVEAIV